MSKLTRRQFIKTAAVATAGGMTMGFQMPSPSAVGANGDIRIGVAGLGGRGSGHVSTFNGGGRNPIPGVRLVALCDPDTQHVDRAFERAANPAVKKYTDIRKMLEDKEIDAVVFASPHHWHALMTVWACQAGKDVYCEKPATHNVWEGRKMIEAAEKYNRIVQIGAQRRSDPGWKEAMAFLKEGSLGKPLFSRGLCYKKRDSIGKVAGPTPIPENIDYNLWSGPREPVPLMRKELHYDWHWVFSSGNGDLGNQGVHQMDVAAWAVDAKELPTGAISVGGRFGYVDDGETPNTQIVLLDYKPTPVIFEVRGLANKETGDLDPYRGARVGNIIECENGYIAESRAYDKDGKEMKQFPGGFQGGPIQQNWINAVRSRKQADLDSPLLPGHVSAACCHLGNISHQVGKTADVDAIKATLKDHNGAMETFERFQEHLAKSGVDLKVDKATLGPWLNIDPKAEKFIGDGPEVAAANALLKDPYRAEFSIPDMV